MIRTFILDDEKDSIDTIKSLVNIYNIELDIVGTARTIKEAYNSILALKPQLLMLDIKIGDKLSFELLEMLPRDNYQLLCISAHNEYAVKAFKYSAVDYLLKPIDVDELNAAVKRVKTNIDQNKSNLHHISALIENFNAPQPYKLSIASSEGLEFIDINDILTIKAEGSYSIITLLGSKRKTISKNIGDFIAQIPHNDFCRIHNSFAINLKHVKKVYRKGGMEVEMIEGERLPVARNRKDTFMDMIKNVVHINS